MNKQSVIISGRHLAEVAGQQGGSLESATNDQASLSEFETIIGAVAVVNDEGRGLESQGEPSAEETDALRMQYDAALELLREADENPGVFSTTENQLAAVIQSALAERAERHAKLQPGVGGLEAKFDTRDLRWVLSLVTWVGKLKPHRWLPPPQQPDTIDGNLRFAVVGDWGTGLYGAPECKASILESAPYDCVVHLGDIYYSGTTKEVNQNFLAHWPFVDGALNRACNGNHEMYSGGYGYFDTLLERFDQRSSCFAIQNAHWLIVGLDSAYADHDLAHNQNVWLRQLVRNAGDRKVVLFTHHQPFSHFDGPGDKLIQKLVPLLNAGRITAWYWGHEHRCVVYDKHPRWGLYGRCVGHSGYPYFRKKSLVFPQASDPPPTHHGLWREIPENLATQTPRALLLDGPNPYLADHRDEYGPNGYLALEFQGDTLTERYYAATGAELRPALTIR